MTLKPRCPGGGGGVRAAPLCWACSEPARRWLFPHSPAQTAALPWPVPAPGLVSAAACPRSWSRGSGVRPAGQAPGPQPASLSTFAHTPFCSRPTRVSGLWLLAILKHPSARAGKCLHLTQSCHVPSVTGRAESFSLPASLTHKTPRRPSVAWTQRDCGRSRVLLQALKGSAT